MKKTSIKYSLFSNLIEKDKLVELINKSINNQNYLIITKVPLGDIGKHYSLIKRFFDLPIEVKNKYSHKLINEKEQGVLGYFAKYKETAVGSKIPDVKEFFHIGKQSLSNKHIEEKSTWPKEILDFEKNFTSLYNTLDKIASYIFMFLCKSVLGIKEDYVDYIVNNSSSILRLISYPKIDESEIGVRAHEHTGINLIGLCLPATSSGLQYKHTESSWEDAPILSSCDVIINFGEMLSFISGNVINASLHRVVNPRQEMNHKRYSIVHFYQPSLQTELINSKTNKAIKSGHLLKQRINKLYNSNIT